MSTPDLTPFGFTPTESLVYAALLRLGPSTGYAVARGTRLARANAYAALEGLVARGAATRAAPPAARPARYRPVDPQRLLAHLAALQGAALDRLSASLQDVPRAAAEPVTREISGARAVANLVMQIVARAEQSVRGTLAGALVRATLPAWRRAAERAQVTVGITGDIPPDPPAGLSPAPPEAGDGALPAIIVDDSQLLATSEGGEDVIWSSHPLLVALARRALDR